MKRPTPMQSYRKRLRARGLRPVQLWVRDTRSPAFIEAFRRQALLVAAREAADGAERRAIEALLKTQDTTGWER
jgi:Protein  of unknown function (DUF3018)